MNYSQTQTHIFIITCFQQLQTQKQYLLHSSKNRSSGYLVNGQENQNTKEEKIMPYQRTELIKKQRCENKKTGFFNS